MNFYGFAVNKVLPQLSVVGGHLSCRLKPCLQRQILGKQTRAHSSVLNVLHKTGLKKTDTGILKDTVQQPNLIDLTPVSLPRRKLSLLQRNGLFTLKQVIRVIVSNLIQCQPSCLHTDKYRFAFEGKKASTCTYSAISQKI